MTSLSTREPRAKMGVTGILSLGEAAPPELGAAPSAAQRDLRELDSGEGSNLAGALGQGLGEVEGRGTGTQGGRRKGDKEGNPAGLSSCSGGLRPLVELCVDPAGFSGSR